MAEAAEIEKWRKKRVALSFDPRPFIGGKREPSRSDAVFERRSPSDDAHLYDLPVGSQLDVDLAVQSARHAFEAGVWEASPLMRKAILFAFAELIDRHQDDLALLDCVEMGKPITSALQDAFAAAHIVRYFAEYCDKLTADVAPFSGSLIQYNVRESRGVIVAIVPWNYPLPNAALKLAPALATGNSVVLKPSELSSGSALMLAELALQAGVPAGVFNVVTGLGPSVGASLAAHRDVDLVAFTGSTATGRELLKSVGSSSLKPLQLECGGKSANIVFEDCADKDAVAADAARRIFENQGQLCVAGTRLIVANAIKDDLVARICRIAQDLQIGDPLDSRTNFGPLASSSRAEAVLAHCERGEKTGARLVIGGRRAAAKASSCFIEPTIFDGVTPAMSIAQDDIFGPVLSVMSFETLDQAISLANSTRYGLSASVWTKDIATGHAAIRRLKAGRIAIHAAPASPASFAFPMAAEPLGDSGFGAESGREGIVSYTHLKAVETHA